MRSVFAQLLGQFMEKPSVSFIGAAPLEMWGKLSSSLSSPR